MKKIKIKSCGKKEIKFSKLKYFVIFIFITLIFLLRNKSNYKNEIENKNETKNENKTKNINNERNDWIKENKTKIMNNEKNDWIKGNKTKILEKYISNFKGNLGKETNLDIKRLKDLFSLKVMLKDENSTLNIELKNNLRDKLSKRFKKNIKLVKNIFITHICYFGNRMVALNNIIYYSEILGIKNIYLNSKYDWYIKSDIITDKLNISVISSSQINCNSNYTICGHIFFDFFFFPVLILPERRFTILKDEIKRNLPKIEIKKDDLYIYIRSGDIFKKNPGGYIPAPYCFYKRILETAKYNDVYLISMDDLNPVIGKLLKEYPKIIHNLNKVEVDISILSNAYNLVNQVSSFVLSCIALNDNLINLWDYDTYKLTDKVHLLHFDLFKINRVFNVYRMKPDEEYFYQKMYIWTRSEEQLKTLFEEKCKYDFKKTVYRDISFP